MSCWTIQRIPVIDFCPGAFEMMCRLESFSLRSRSLYTNGTHEELIVLGKPNKTDTKEITINCLCPISSNQLRII